MDVLTDTFGVNKNRPQWHMDVLTDTFGVNKNRPQWHKTGNTGFGV